MFYLGKTCHIVTRKGGPRSAEGARLIAPQYNRDHVHPVAMSLRHIRWSRLVSWSQHHSYSSSRHQHRAAANSHGELCLEQDRLSVWLTPPLGCTNTQHRVLHLFEKPDRDFPSHGMTSKSCEHRLRRVGRKSPLKLDRNQSQQRA